MEENERLSRLISLFENGFISPSYLLEELNEIITTYRGRFIK